MRPLTPLEHAIWYGHPEFSHLRGLMDVTHMESIQPQPIITHKGPNRKQRRANKKAGN